MPVLPASVDTYQASRSVQLVVLAQLGEQIEIALAGCGDRYVQRHRDRGCPPVRERIDPLFDADSPFLELSMLATWGTEFAVGASVAGIASCPAWSE